MKLLQTDTATKAQSSAPFFGKGGGEGLSATKAETPFFGSKPVQAKLTVGAPDDQYEQEADAVASKVVQRLAVSGSDATPPSQPKAGPFITPFVQRKCAACEKEERLQKKEKGSGQQPRSVSGIGPVQRKCSACAHEEQVQKKEEGHQPNTTPPLESRLTASRGSGSPLPEPVRNDMGQAMGADFSKVRIHTGSNAEGMNRELSAHAFTHGNDIYFNTGKYDSNSTAGKHLLAHELTHVVQQSGTNTIQRQVAGAVREHGDLAQVPATLQCPVATTAPAAAQTARFRISSSRLSPAVKRTISAFAGSWHSLGATASVRLDGYASTEGADSMNWTLSCSRAVAVKNEMMRPSDGTTGIPASFITLFAHGETNRFSTSSLEENRLVTITSTVPLPDPDPDPHPDPQPDPDPEPDPQPEPQHCDQQQVNQLRCVRRLGGCANTRSGGVPTPEEIEGYNRECRGETHYTGPDVTPTTEECITPPVDCSERPLENPICGPDITSPLTSMLSSVDAYFHGLTSFQKRRSCMALDLDSPFALVNPIMAWDVDELFLPNTGVLDPYFLRYSCGSPRNPGCDTDATRSLCESENTCGNTVLVGGRCMLAGTANYALYGRMFKLCNTEFSPDFPRWDMTAMITLYKTISGDDAGPPLAMSTSTFDGTFPTIPAAAENRSYCTGRCARAYAGRFNFTWEPYRSR